MASAIGGFMAGSIVAKLLLDKTGWNESIKAVDKDLAYLATEVKKVGEAQAKVGKAFVATGLAIVAGLVAIVKKTADAGDALWDMSQRTGIATETLSGLKLAAEKSGTSIEGLAIGLRFLGKSMVNNADAFKSMGVSVTDVNGKLRPMQDVMLDVADRFAGMENGAEKTALAIQLFGRSGTELIPLLNLGSEGLRREMEMAKRLGTVFDEQAARAADKFNDALIELKYAVSGVGLTIGNSLIPAVQRVVKLVTDWVASMNALARENSGLVQTFMELTLALGVSMTVIGTFTLAIGKLKIFLATLAIALGTTTTSVIALTAAWAAGAAGVGYYILKLLELEEAKARFRAAESNDLKYAERLNQQLRDAATLTLELGQSMSDFVSDADMDKIIASYGEFSAASLIAAERAILLGKHGPALAAALKQVRDEANAAAEKGRLAALGMSALDESLLKLGIDVPGIKKELALAEQTLSELKASGDPLPGVIQAIEDKIKSLKEQLFGANSQIVITTKSFNDFTRTWVNLKRELIEPIPIKIFGDFNPDEILFKLQRLPPAIGTIEWALRNAALAGKNAAEAIGTGFQGAATKMYSSLQGFAARAAQVFAGLNEIFNQLQVNEEIRLDNEYKKRLDFINLTIHDETQKQKAIIALEAEYEIKRTSAKRKAAKQQKAVALMEAIVNTAVAVSKALSQGGFLLGIPWAAIIAALGAVQIATIAAQPIPLAEGAGFDKPTLLKNVLIGEKGPEYVLPERKLINIVRDAMTLPRFNAAPVMAMAGGGGATVTLNMNGPLISTTGVSRRDLEAAGEDMVAIVDRQLRRVGRRL